MRVEIVAPKIKPDDAETRKLFEQIAARIAQAAGETILIYLSRRNGIIRTNHDEH